MTRNEQQPRIVWIDLLRLVALLMVISAHCVDIYNVTPDVEATDSRWGAIIGSLMRPSVPLFAMMTGLLLLPVRQAAGAVYRKRIPRVLIPMLLWSAIYCLSPWLIGVLGGGADVVSTFFPMEQAPSQSLGDALRNVAAIPFTFNNYTTHMWYIYMLIGLYFVMPFMSAWIEKDDRTMTRTFVILWGCSLLLPYLRYAVAPYIFGECAWNDFGTLYCFAGFSGYLLLGHLLKNGNPLKTRQVLLLALLLFASGYAITYTGFRSMSAQYSYDEHPEFLEMFWQFCSPNVVIMAIALFIAVQRAEIRSPQAQRLLSDISRCSFGAYLMHYLLIGPAVLLLAPLHLPTPLHVLCAVVIVFAACWAITHAIYALFPRAARYIVG